MTLTHETEPAPEKPAAPRRGTHGVWVHYLIDQHIVSKGDELEAAPFARAISVHAGQLEARTAAMDAEAPGKVVFVPWESTIEEALR